MRQCFIPRTPDTNNKKPETVLLNAFVDPYDCLLNKKNLTKKNHNDRFLIFQVVV